MRPALRTSIAALAIAGSLAALPAGAQTLGNPSSGGAGSTTGSFGTGSATGSFSSGSSGSSLENSGAAGGLDTLDAPGSGSTIGSSGSASGIGPGIGSSSSGIGSSGVSSGSSSLSDDTQRRATEGSSTINEINAGSFARSGDAGTSDVTGFGGEGSSMASSESGRSYTPGAGSASDYRIPTPPVGIDLGAIRSGLRNAPSATPKANGD